VFFSVFSLQANEENQSQLTKPPWVKEISDFFPAPFDPIAPPFLPFFFSPFQTLVSVSAAMILRYFNPLGSFSLSLHGVSWLILPPAC